MSFRETMLAALSPSDGWEWDFPGLYQRRMASGRWIVIDEDDTIRVGVYRPDATGHWVESPDAGDVALEEFPDCASAAAYASGIIKSDAEDRIQ